jgi:hypothetical protein
MPYSAPTSITTGQLLTASLMNTDWGGNITFLANPPACRVRRTSTQSINTVTDTAIGFDAERYDTDTMHDTVTNNTRITMTTAGLYAVGGHLEYDSSTAGTMRAIHVRVNGTSVIGSQYIPPIANGRLSVSTTWKFAATDYIEIVTFHDAGSARTISTATYSAEAYATWIGLG